ncbi:PAS domain S-box protein [Draconibacterium sp.]|nr:PAS domain S-box protein [Draconibacterium sp.]
MEKLKKINEQLLLENKLLRNQLNELNGIEQKHKLVKNALSDLEERFKVIFESAPDAIYLMNTDAVFLQINAVVERIFGYSESEIVGKSLIELNLISDEEFKKINRSFKENLRGNNYGPELITWKNRKGETVYSELTSYPVKINDRTMILGVSRDITEKIKTEDTLRENEQLLSLHFNQTPLGVIEWDLDFKVKKWNVAASRIFGFDENEAIGKRANFIVHETALSHTEEIWNDLLLFKGGKKSTNQNITKTGKIILCEWYNTPLVNEEGEIIAVASLVQDISERIRTENMQKVLYNISNAVNTTDNLHKLIGLIKDELGVIIDTTNFYIALYNKEDDTLSLPFFIDEIDEFTAIPAGKTLTKYVIKTRKALLANSQVMNEMEQKGEIEAVGADSKIWLGVPLKLEGAIIGVLAVQSYTNEKAYNLADVKMLEFVSEQIGLSIHRKKTEEELVEALKRAEDSDRLKNSFLQNMSHEIRTPMNGILGFISLLKEPGLNSKKQNKYIGIIEKSGVRMLNTINDLMDISKIESGQMDVKIEETHINNQIKELYTFFKPEAEAKGLKLVANKPLSGSEAIIATDREKLFAILTNLVKNAIKYSGEGVVEFGYGKRENIFEFFVKDTGIGIPDEMLESVFDRFVQVDQRLARTFEGTGLGLAITKAYVEMLGGKIWLESAIGIGTKFSFTLPDKSQNRKAVIVKNEKKEPAKIECKNLKILVAEDDETIRTYLKIVIRKICKDVLFTGNGIETVETIRDNSDIDLVLMDIKMPEMDGYEATGKIRTFNKDVIIIAQTAFTLETEQEKIFSAGFNDYIAKPIKRDDLIEKIEKYFGV